MKSKIAFIVLICAAVAATVLSLRHPKANKLTGPITRDKIQLSGSESNPSLPALMVEPKKSQVSEGLTAADQEALKVIENGLRHIGNEAVESRDRRARTGNAAMESFLKNWKAIGRTPTDLKAVFGKPQRESNHRLLYSFDTGNYAWSYQFEVYNGSVVELKRPLSE